MAYADRVANSARLTTIAGVAAIHGLLGYAFITGMAASFVHDISTTLTTHNVPIDSPPPPDPLPTPETMTAKPTQPTVITVTKPIVPSQPADTHVPVLPFPPLPPLPYDPPVNLAGDATLPPPALSKAVGVRASGNRAAWITTEDYPPSALRSGEEGVVGIALQVGADGRPQSCAVTMPSGHASLDQATCRLYQRRARFAPARDDAGSAIAATYTDRVRWVLPM